MNSAIIKTIADLTGLNFCDENCCCGENSQLWFFPAGGGPGQDEVPEWVPGWMHGSDTDEIWEWIRDAYNDHLPAVRN